MSSLTAVLVFTLIIAVAAVILSLYNRRDINKIRKVLKGEPFNIDFKTWFDLDGE